jgi:ABC-type multidrug transport system ATPase subunit
MHTGSGKTTLVHAIAGALPSSTRVLLDGAASYGAPVLDDGSVALLKQDDGFFGMLTVRETLAVAAELQPPPTAGHPHAPLERAARVDQTRQRAARVDQTLRALGLEPVAGTRVGDRSHRGISGGELRRLSVGCALLGDPQLLVADEPTSGLDSHQAERVVLLLRELARERAIPAVATLHQPKSSIFHSLDDLLLLAPGGRVAYHGPTAKALDYFRAMGHKCPPQTNPAEFLIDLVSIDQDSERGGDEARRRIEDIVERCSASARGGRAMGANASPEAILSGSGVAVSLATASPDAPTFGFAARRRLRPLRALRSAAAAVCHAARRLSPVGAGAAWSARPTARRAPLFRRIRTLVLRAWRQNVRDITTNGLRLGACLTLALLFGDMFGALGQPSAASVSSRVELLSYASIVMSMMALMK